MSSYDTVLQAVQTRVNALVQKGAGLSEAEAVAKVFRDDPDLYRQYREAAGRQPARSRADAPARLIPTPTGAEAEAMRKAETLVAKRADLSITDALTQVFRDDGTLYERYREQSTRKGEAPSFGATLMAGQMDELQAYAGALLRTIHGVLASDATDAERGAQIAQALDAFRAAVLGKLGEAGLTVPAAKSAPSLPDSAHALATLLAPQDPAGKGLRQVDRCLQELIATIKRRAA
jgi:hypothetical protein